MVQSDGCTPRFRWFTQKSSVSGSHFPSSAIACRAGCRWISRRKHFSTSTVFHHRSYM